MDCRGRCLSPVEKQETDLRCHLVSNEELTQQLKTFWELESVPKETPLTKEEQECERQFAKSHSRNHSGRYIVSLPIRQEKIQSIGYSRSIAMKRFEYLERRFVKAPAVVEAYHEFMNEYETLAHMYCVDAPQDNFPHFYLPHHAIFKESSTTTKTRVVFDGSAHTSADFSLNDCLMVGPNVQRDLFDIVLCFRKHRYVLTGDV